MKRKPPVNWLEGEKPERKLIVSPGEELLSSHKKPKVKWSPGVLPPKRKNNMKVTTWFNPADKVEHDRQRELVQRLPFYYPTPTIPDEIKQALKRGPGTAFEVKNDLFRPYNDEENWLAPFLVDRSDETAALKILEKPAGSIATYCGFVECNEKKFQAFSYENNRLIISIVRHFFIIGSGRYIIISLGALEPL